MEENETEQRLEHKKDYTHLYSIKTVKETHEDAPSLHQNTDIVSILQQDLHLSDSEDDEIERKTYSEKIKELTTNLDDMIKKLRAKEQEIK